MPLAARVPHPLEGGPRLVELRRRRRPLGLDHRQLLRPLALLGVLGPRLGRPRRRLRLLGLGLGRAGIDLEQGLPRRHPLAALSTVRLVTAPETGADR
jgi:hypothetical protein